MSEEHTHARRGGGRLWPAVSAARASKIEEAAAVCPPAPLASVSLRVSFPDRARSPADAHERDVDVAALGVHVVRPDLVAAEERVRAAVVLDLVVDVVRETRDVEAEVRPARVVPGHLVAAGVVGVAYLE